MDPWAKRMLLLQKSAIPAARATRALRADEAPPPKPRKA